MYTHAAGRGTWKILPTQAGCKSLPRYTNKPTKHANIMVTIANKFNAEYAVVDERLGFDFPAYCARAGRPLCKIHWLRYATYFNSFDRLTIAEAKELVDGYKRRAEMQTNVWTVEVVDFDEHQMRGSER